MHRISIRGTIGVLRWGYYDAAQLGPWTLDDGTLTATVVKVDTFRISQQPLTFLVPHRQGWRWPVTSLQWSGNSLVASLGPQES